MAITWYDNLDDLIDAATPRPSDEVIKLITNEVEAILLKHIKTDVYRAYKPKEGAWVGGSTYIRRHVLENHIKTVQEADGTLLTTSDAPAGQSVVKGYNFSNEDSGFLRLLESGHMGIWKSGFARPVVSNAQREVDNSSKIQSILERGARKEINK